MDLDEMVVPPPLVLAGHYRGDVLVVVPLLQLVHDYLESDSIEKVLTRVFD